MKDEVVIILVLVLVVASTGAGYFIGYSSQHTTTTVSTTISCIRTGQGYALYVRVATDRTNASIAGAKVDAISYTVCASGDTEWGDPITAVTPNNGTISLPVSAIDGYSIIVSYQGSSYFAGEVFIAPVEVTIVTLTVPSGNVTVTHSPPF
jgi:hypothetical protein